MKYQQFRFVVRNTLGESLLQHKVLVWFGNYLFYHLSLNKLNPWLLLEVESCSIYLAGLFIYLFFTLLNNLRTLKAWPMNEKIKFNLVKRKRGISLTWQIEI